MSKKITNFILQSHLPGANEMSTGIAHLSKSDYLRSVSFQIDGMQVKNID